MIINDTVSIKWNPRNKKYYINKGYIFTKMGDEFKVKINDLTHCSKIKVEIKCDYCGNIYSKEYNDYTKSHNVINKDACNKCKVIKSKESNINKYGVDNPFCLEEFQDKAKTTIKNRYNVDNISQCKDIQNKIKKNNLLKYGVESTSSLEVTKGKAINTCNKKYGTDYAMQTKEFQQKLEETSYKKYGVKRPTQCKEIQDKVKKTNIMKYGVENPTKNKEILSKSIHSRYLHGTFTCSKQQYELYQIIGGELNYPYNNFVIDVAYPDKKIAVEWNGSGHDLSVRLGKISQTNFNRNENFRRKTLFQNDWKIITFVTYKDIILSNNIMKIVFNYCLDYLNNNGHSIFVMLDDNEIIYKNKHININDIIKTL